jgi:glycosyltransferase involved in cell wall biosynthesis
MSSQLTVVIPAHRYDERLEALLQGLDLQARDEGTALRVVVADDGSRDPIERRIRLDTLPALELVVVRSETSGGPGAARNRALAHVETPWVVLMDSDELPGAGWLSLLHRLIARDDAPDGIEGRVTAGDEKATPFTHVTEVSAADDEHVAGNVAFRTDVLRDAGGFSERFFDRARGLHFREDIELYFRLRAAGRRIEYCDELVALHPPLPPSFAVPLRDARRYYFDPLLSRLHPRQFRESNAARRVGGIPLRRARHLAALAHGLGTVVLAVGALGRHASTIGAGVAVLTASLGANTMALSWRRRVTPGMLPALLAAAALAPYVYLWHYYRGCLRFRHLPRL